MAYSSPGHDRRASSDGGLFSESGGALAEIEMSQLVKAIQATPRRPGVEEIRIPSQRAFRERERRRAEAYSSTMR